MSRIALLMLFVAPIVGIVALVFRVDVATWNLVVVIIASAVFILAVGASVHLYLRGRAKLEEARALSTAAEGRRIHGTPAPAPVYTTVNNNMLRLQNPDTGEVRQLPAGDTEQAAQWMRQYAADGYKVVGMEPKTGAQK